MDDKLYEKLIEEFPQNAYNVDKSRGFPLIGVRGAFVVERLNDVFGLLGTGWRFAHSPFVDHGKEITTEVALQYRVESDGEAPFIWDGVSDSWIPDPNSGKHYWSQPVYGVGGNQKGSGGVPISDAQKSAVSSALSKAASRLGVGIDAYKGNLSTDSQGKVILKGDSEDAPSGDAKLTKKLLNTLMINLPDEYDKLAGSESYVAKNKAGLIAAITSAIEKVDLTAFVAENLAAISGIKGAKSIEDLPTRNLLLVNAVCKSIASGDVTWKEALEIAGSLGENTWEEAVASLKDSKQNDDS